MAFEDAYGEVLSTSHVAGYYDESNDSYLHVLHSLLPTGAAWIFEASSDMLGFLEGLSYSFLRLANRSKDVLEEYDPRTMVELLPDWERILGLPGTNPTPPTTLEGRRGAVHSKLLGHGDPNEQFFIDVAAGIGYTVIINHKEYDPFVAGSPVGDSLTNHDWAFYWKVLSNPGSDDTLLEWLIESLTPSHTTVDVIIWGVDWIEQKNPQDIGLNGIAHDPIVDHWVAVGNNIGGDAYIITSTDAINWKEQAPTVAKAVNLTDVAYGAYANYWVAVGLGDGVDAYILTSSDGEVWAEQAPTVPKNIGLFGVAHNSVNGVWVAVGAPDGVDAYIVTTSGAGTVWTERANPKNAALLGVAYNGSDLWVAVGSPDGGGDAYIVTSGNGFTWFEQSNPKNFILFDVAYANGLWVAVGGADGTDAYIITSVDGINWVERENPKNFDLLSVAYANGLWIAVGDADGTDPYIVTSSNGIDWVERGPAISKDLYLAGIAAGSDMWIAVGEDDGTDAYILTSG